MMFSNDFNYVGMPSFLNATFGVKKGSELYSKLSRIQEQGYFNQQASIRKWFGFGYLNGYYIDKGFETENDLNVAMLLTLPVYAFKDEKNNNEPVGTDVELLYFFAKDNKYKVNLIEVDSYEEQVEMLKNGSADIAGGNFIQRQEKEITDNVDFIYFRPTVLIHLIRYENSQASATWNKFYEKEEDLNGKLLGIIPSSSFVDLTKQNFPNSPTFDCTDIFNSFERLLLNYIEGFLADEPIAQYFSLLFPDSITYFQKDYYKNNYGFGFQQSNTELLSEFNAFLSKSNKEELYNQWMNNPENMQIDKDYETESDAKTITAAFYLVQKPLSYREGSDIKGFEIDLVYRFAKEKGYKLDLKECSLEERMNFLQADSTNKVDITGGDFTINDERKKNNQFFRYCL